MATASSLSGSLLKTPREKRDGPVITILNLKGGVGKTHAAWLLTGVAEERGEKLLAIDLDPQANLTKSLLDGKTANVGIERLFDPAVEIDPLSLIVETKFEHVSLLPAASSLAAFDLADQKVWEEADLHLSLVDPIAELRANYELIVFDCPPRLSLVSFAALCSSDFVVIPLEAADWGAQGIVQVSAAVEYVRKRFNPNLTLLGYLVSRFKRARSFQRSYLKKLREHFGTLAFETVIPDLALFEKSVTVGVPITLHAPSSIEAGTARRFFAEVQRRIGRGRRVRVAGAMPLFKSDPYLLGKTDPLPGKEKGS